MNVNWKTRFMLEKFLKFAEGGAVVTLVQYVLLVLIVEQSVVNETLASAIAFSFSAVINYLLNYRYALESDLRPRQVVPKLVLTAVIGLCINTLAFEILLTVSNLYYLLCQIVATFIVLLWNFVINTSWSFRRSKT